MNPTTQFSIQAPLEIMIVRRETGISMLDPQSERTQTRQDPLVTSWIEAGGQRYSKVMMMFRADVRR